jgi:hypothetical protein
MVGSVKDELPGTVGSFAAAAESIVPAVVIAVCSIGRVAP